MPDTLSTISPAPWRRDEDLILDRDDAVLFRIGNGGPFLSPKDPANAAAVLALPDLLAAAQPLASLVAPFSGEDAATVAVTAGELRALLKACRRASEHDA